MCPIQVSVDDHLLTIIASDVGAVEPITVKSFVLGPGERYFAFD